MVNVCKWQIKISLLLQGSEHLPCRCINRKSRIDGVLFEQWLQKIDKTLAIEEKIILVVDNYLAQPTIDNLDLIEIIFIPVINPSKLLLMNQGTP